MPSAAGRTGIATEHGFTFWLAGGLILRGWFLVEQEAWADGIAHLRDGLAAWAATNGAAHRTYHLTLLAEALRRNGQMEEGLAALGEGLGLMDVTGESFHGAELHRLQGEFLLRQDPAQAEACFHRALAVARRQQAKSLELRAAMSLTRRCRKQNRDAEGRPLLAEDYGWLTEGFDTPDLQEAKALPEPLS